MYGQIKGRTELGLGVSLPGSVEIHSLYESMALSSLPTLRPLGLGLGLGLPIVDKGKDSISTSLQLLSRATPSLSTSQALTQSSSLCRRVADHPVGFLQTPGSATLFPRGLVLLLFVPVGGGEFRGGRL